MEDSKSLLAHIAGSFISQYENVANSSICYLLNEYPAARRALANILGGDTVPDNYQTEQATQSGSRPDVTGKDGDGKTVVIIEGKFWAGLTDSQPNDYLRELAGGGKLLFLAPDNRISSLKPVLEERLDDDKDLGRLLVSSWNNFLKLIEGENTKNYNADLAGDLKQLKALCQKMDVEGMPPLSLSDLDPMNGRITMQLVDVIDECRGILRGWDHANFDGLTATNTRYGYGFYFAAFNFLGCVLYFSSDRWFRLPNHTPIWLRVEKYLPSSRRFERYQKIDDALEKYDRDNSYENKIGIILEPGKDKEQVVKHIVCRVKKVLKYLNNEVVR